MEHRQFNFIEELSDGPLQRRWIVEINPGEVKSTGFKAVVAKVGIVGWNYNMLTYGFYVDAPTDAANNQFTFLGANALKQLTAFIQEQNDKTAIIYREGKLDNVGNRIQA